ncbi:hypothetical protein B0H11DRAFT_767104 [Mycena galericulata]|nr:hypothetical protein B0H11DRAFT_767104 [Mycena galericulata]
MRLSSIGPGTKVCCLVLTTSFLKAVSAVFMKTVHWTGYFFLPRPELGMWCADFPLSPSLGTTLVTHIFEPRSFTNARVKGGGQSRPWKCVSRPRSSRSLSSTKDKAIRSYHRASQITDRRFFN